MFIGRQDGDRFVSANVPTPWPALVISVACALTAVFTGLWGVVAFVGVVTARHSTPDQRFIVGIVSAVMVFITVRLVWRSFSHFMIWRRYRGPYRRLFWR
jgi:hypothetical protein